MERIFIQNLKKELGKRIKGRVYAHIIGDELIVDIYMSYTLTWHYTLDNIRMNIATGLSSTIVANVIVKKYKRYVLERYFYTK